MTICIATNLFYPARGGVPNYYWYLAACLSKTGHRVIVLRPGLELEDKSDRVEINNDITVVTLFETYNRHYYQFAKFFRPGDYEAHSWLAMGYAMKEWLLKNNHYSIDIIEVPDYGGLAVLLKDERLPPVLINGHSAMLQLQPYDHIPDNDHTKVLRKLETLSFRYADGIVAHSLLNQQELSTLARRPVFFARAPWIPPTAAVRNSSIPGKFIVVGRLHMAKGPGVMAEAVKLIIEKKPSFKLEWIGQDTHTAPGGQLVTAYLEKNYPEIWGKNFIWKDALPHEKILEEVANAEFAFIPSIWETFNYFSLEAAWLLLPFLITEQTGSVYLFKDFPGVINVVANDPAAIAAAYLKWDKHRATKTENNHTRKNLADYFSAANIIGDRMPIYEALRDKGSKNMDSMGNELEFLNDYLSFSRKAYYFIRRTIKSAVKKPKPPHE